MISATPERPTPMPNWIPASTPGHDAGAQYRPDRRGQRQRHQVSGSTLTAVMKMNAWVTVGWYCRHSMSRNDAVIDQFEKFENGGLLGKTSDAQGIKKLMMNPVPSSPLQGRAECLGLLQGVGQVITAKTGRHQAENGFQYDRHQGILGSFRTKVKQGAAEAGRSGHLLLHGETATVVS